MARQETCLLQLPRSPSPRRTHPPWQDKRPAFYSCPQPPSPRRTHPPRQDKKDSGIKLRSLSSGPSLSTVQCLPFTHTKPLSAETPAQLHAAAAAALTRQPLRESPAPGWGNEDERTWVVPTASKTSWMDRRPVSQTSQPCCARTSDGRTVLGAS